LGSDALKSLVHDVVLIERVNSPGWSQVEMQALSSRVLHSKFRRVATCSAPAPSLVSELETVSMNKTKDQKNQILGRHGKSLLPLDPTHFDDWVMPGGLLRATVALWLIESCQAVVLWSFSDWGLYALVLGRSDDEALEPALRAGRELNIPTRQHAESNLPTW
jgi:hypothetical protein